MKRLSAILLFLGLAGCDNSTISIFNSEGYYQSCNVWKLKVSKDINVRRWCRITEDHNHHFGYEEIRDDDGNLLSKGIAKYFHH